MNGNPKDTSGNRYNGIAQRGATLTSDRFGQAKKAYHFDGTANGYIEVSHTRFISGNAISVSFWFTTAASGFSGYFIMSNDFAIYYDSNLSEIRFYIYTYENSMNSAAVRITENTWTHIVGTYDGTDIMIYTNGVVRAITHWPGTM